MKTLFRKLTWILNRRRKETDLDDELRFHLEEEASQRQEQGLPPAQARAAARRELGNVTLVAENTRAAWGWTLLDQLAQDLRYAARTMLQNKAFTALAALSLALGIGANTAIYSFLDAIMLRSLPVRDPGSLAVPYWRIPEKARRQSVIHSFSGSFGDDPKTGYMTGNIFPYPAFEAFQKNGALFSSMFGFYHRRDFNITVRGQADMADGLYVTGEYFTGLGVPPAAGRLIALDDDRPGAPAVAVISSALARTRFGDAASAVGQSMLVNNVPVTVIGVAPPEFFGTDPGAAPQLFIPLRVSPVVEAATDHGIDADSLKAQSFYWFRIMLRLHPGVTLPQAQAALAPVYFQSVSATAVNDTQRANLPTLVLREGGHGLKTLRNRYSEPLLLLSILVGLILAIACANIANLLLARAAARKREIALRLSVGAGRFRVIRQLLTESLLLASIGGALGILFAVWGIRFLTLLLAKGNEDFTLHAGLNWHVLGIAAGFSLLTGVLFGLAPAAQATRVDILPALKSMAPARRRSHFGISLSHVLLVTQIALSLLMLAGASLFTRTLINLQHVNIGFNRENLLLFQVNGRQSGHKEPDLPAFYNDLQSRFAAIPGVRNVSLAQTALIGEGHWGSPVEVDGQETKDTVFVLVGSSYFTTMQIAMRAGREIDSHDHPGAQTVAVVNQTFAKANFSGSPLGRYFNFSGARAKQHTPIQIVGVCADPLYGSLDEAIPPTVFIAYNQGAWPVEEMTFSLRTTGDPLTYAKAVRQIVHDADERLPVARIRSQSAEIDHDINQEIIFARLCTAFALLALVIACVGLYGTFSYQVARRSSEIGIRMALGAQRGTVIWMVLRGVIALAAVGLAVSIPAACAGSKLVKSYLFGLKPDDPIALTLAVSALLTAALLAGYAPARKAARIDPMTALRNE